MQLSYCSYHDNQIFNVNICQQVRLLFEKQGFSLVLSAQRHFKSNAVGSSFLENLLLNLCTFRRLVDKLENMHNSAIGDGRETCLLCNSKFGTLKVVAKRCDICEKVRYH